MEMQKIKVYSITIEVFGDNEEEVYNDIRIETSDITMFISQIMQNGFILTDEDGLIVGLSPAKIAKIIAKHDDNDHILFNGHYSNN